MRTVLAFMFVCLFSASAQQAEAGNYGCCGSPAFVQQGGFEERIDPFTGVRFTTFVTGNQVRTFGEFTNAFFASQSAFGFEVERRRPQSRPVIIKIGR